MFYLSLRIVFLLRCQPGHDLFSTNLRSCSRQRATIPHISRQSPTEVRRPCQLSLRNPRLCLPSFIAYHRRKLMHCLRETTLPLTAHIVGSCIQHRPVSLSHRTRHLIHNLYQLHPGQAISTRTVPSIKVQSGCMGISRQRPSTVLPCSGALLPLLSRDTPSERI